MSEVSKLKRAEFYREHRTQLLLSKFISGELSRLEPTYDSKCGYHYPLVEAILGSAEKVDEFLEELYNAKILERELYDKIVHCPFCDSTNLSTHYCCPYCKSFNIKKSSLIEHIKCGYIDVEEKFRVDDKLVCPRCNKELAEADVDYRKAGVWCVCNECGKNFDVPVTSHFCRDCHKTFMFEDLIYKDVYSYSLSDVAKKETLRGMVIIAPIREFLQNNGFTVESPGFLKGKSEANHMFDLAAFRNGVPQEVTVIDLAIAAEGEISEQPIIAMFAKTYDVAPHKACLIAIPGANENGRKMATLYNIELIEAKDQNEAIKMLGEKLLVEKRRTTNR